MKTLPGQEQAVVGHHVTMRQDTLLRHYQQQQQQQQQHQQQHQHQQLRLQTMTTMTSYSNRAARGYEMSQIIVLYQEFCLLSRSMKVWCHPAKEASASLTAFALNHNPSKSNSEGLPTTPVTQYAKYNKVCLGLCSSHS
jgi:hypothetical protein